MKITKNVDMTNVKLGSGGGSHLSEEAQMVVDFANSDDKNIKFECDDKDEANKVYSVLHGVKTRRKLAVRVSRSGNDIYVLHAEG